MFWISWSQSSSNLSWRQWGPNCFFASFLIDTGFSVTITFYWNILWEGIGLIFSGTSTADLLEGSPRTGDLTQRTGWRGDELYRSIWDFNSGFLNSCMIKALSARCCKLKLFRNSGNVNFLSIEAFRINSSWARGCTLCGVFLFLRRKSNDQSGSAFTLSIYCHFAPRDLLFVDFLSAVLCMEILPVGKYWRLRWSRRG